MIIVGNTLGFLSSGFSIPSKAIWSNIYFVQFQSILLPSIVHASSQVDFYFQSLIKDKAIKLTMVVSSMLPIIGKTCQGLPVQPGTYPLPFYDLKDKRPQLEKELKERQLNRKKILNKNSNYGQPIDSMECSLKERSPSERPHKRKTIKGRRQTQKKETI